VIGMVDFGVKLKKLRTDKHLTQEQLAQRIGLTKSVISAYECSLRYPSYDILIALTRIFGVTTDYLLGANNRKMIDVSRLSESNLQIITNLIDALAEK
jgi:transcriptional regulator with XRE-family HTH domain